MDSFMWGSYLDEQNQTWEKYTKFFKKSKKRFKIQVIIYMFYAIYKWFCGIKNHIFFNMLILAMYIVLAFCDVYMYITFFGFLYIILLKKNILKMFMKIGMNLEACCFKERRWFYSSTRSCWNNARRSFFLHQQSWKVAIWYDILQHNPNLKKIYSLQIVDNLNFWRHWPCTYWRSPQPHEWDTIPLFQTAKWSLYTFSIFMSDFGNRDLNFASDAVILFKINLCMLKTSVYLFDLGLWHVCTTMPHIVNIFYLSYMNADHIFRTKLDATAEYN
jgi:hypothetical protein